MRVYVDPEICIGDESCVEICPEVFEMNGEVASVKIGEVPKEFEDACRQAIDSCPVEAICSDEK